MVELFPEIADAFTKTSFLKTRKLTSGEEEMGNIQYIFSKQHKQISKNGLVISLTNMPLTIVETPPSGWGHSDLCRRSLELRSLAKEPVGGGSQSEKTDAETSVENFRQRAVRFESSGLAQDSSRDTAMKTVIPADLTL